MSSELAKVSVIGIIIFSALAVLGMAGVEAIFDWIGSNFFTVKSCLISVVFFAVLVSILGRMKR